MSGSGIFKNGKDEGIFSGDGVFEDKGPMFSDGPHDHTDGPVTKAEEQAPEVIPPEAHVGQDARDVSPAAHGIAMKAGPDGKPRVARTINGRLAEAWRPPHPAEVAHIQQNAQVVRRPGPPPGGRPPMRGSAKTPAMKRSMGATDAVVEGGSSPWMWVAGAVAVAAGIYWWRNRSTEMLDAVDAEEG